MKSAGIAEQGGKLVTVLIRRNDRKQVAVKENEFFIRIRDHVIAADHAHDMYVADLFEFSGECAVGH